MAWHTLITKTTTIPSCWYYQAHIVVPLELILNYRLDKLYLMETTFSKTLNKNCNKSPNQGPALTVLA